MKTATIHTRINTDTKIKAETILHQLGMTSSEAIRLFYTQITLRNGLPFAITIPNDLTANTLTKSYHGEDIEEFDSLDDMFENWES